MAEIIGYDKTKLKTVTCGGCGAIVQYRKNEVRERHGRDYTGGPDGEEWVVCPGCGGKAIISAW